MVHHAFLIFLSTLAIKIDLYSASKVRSNGRPQVKLTKITYIWVYHGRVLTCEFCGWLMWLLYELQVRGLHQTLLDKYLSIKKTCASWCTNSQRRHLGQLQLKKKHTIQGTHDDTPGWNTDPADLTVPHTGCPGKHEDATQQEDHHQCALGTFRNGLITWCAQVKETLYQMIVWNT